jgi:hypothetical protein
VRKGRGEEGRGKREEGRGKREEGRGKKGRGKGRGKREEGKGKREEGRGKREMGGGKRRQERSGAKNTKYLQQGHGMRSTTCKVHHSGINHLGLISDIHIYRPEVAIPVPPPRHEVSLLCEDH